MKYPQFVWLDGMRGPVWQIWWHEACTKSEGKPVVILAKHEMTEKDQLLTSRELVAKYPPPSPRGGASAASVPQPPPQPLNADAAAPMRTKMDAAS